MPSAALQGSCPLSRTGEPRVDRGRFFPQSQFQGPLQSQPQVSKDLVSGEDVGGTGLGAPEPGLAKRWRQGPFVGTDSG